MNVKSSSAQAEVTLTGIEAWFASQAWRPFAFQSQLWRAGRAGQSGLLHATTGAGKTYAAWFGAVLAAMQANRNGKRTSRGLQVLWITPMRALAADTHAALQAAVLALQPDWQVGLRTGDTSSGERAKQTKQLPQALVTTPESLCLLLAQSDSAERLSQVAAVVVDEWHELIGNKRGVQVQLALARLQRMTLAEPGLVVWGLSATLGNLEKSMEILLGKTQGLLIQGKTPKALRVDTLLPEKTERFPWGGHLGMVMVPAVVEEIDKCASCLVFTNTRSQAELWYQALINARPDWAGIVALHHGSLDKEVRQWVEQGLKTGKLKAVVCTSSLDLGVDFSPVERALQIGSAKGVARLLQRAGRSGHSPGRPSRITLVPTNAFELLESAGAQDAVAARTIEPRVSPSNCIDALVQHLVTVALGGGFKADALFDEVRETWAFRKLTRAEFDWALAFVGHGGESLKAYPEYARVVADEAGVLRVPDRMIAKRHRMSIGTIVSDASIAVKYLSGAKIGNVEESFVGRLKKGDCFLFAGRLLELVRVHEMTAYVRKATGTRAAVPRWNGGKMPLSSEMANAVLARLAFAEKGVWKGPEMRMLKPLLAVQSQWSHIPTPELFLVEQWQSREGYHSYLYPFAGRNVHIGLSSLLAWRLAQRKPATFSIAVNDYGVEMLSATQADWTGLQDGSLLSDDDLHDHLLASLNASELASRKFREIARISGLVFQGYPGAPKSTRQLQASSSLFYEVFRKYDPQNRLLEQADRDTLDQELDLERLRTVLARLRKQRLMIVNIQKPTPFAFPLLIERLREKVSNEKLSDRVARMVADLERQAG